MHANIQKVSLVKLLKIDLKWNDTIVEQVDHECYNCDSKTEC